MRKVLHFNQGPFMGREVEIDLDEATIANLLDTGYCTDVPVAPEPEVVVEAEPEKPKKSVKRKRIVKRKKMETPEG